jgi:mevalonate kinase
MADDVAITVSAPGSLMLLGEHAVLHGHHALVGAINRRITVSLFPIEKAEVRIVSALGSYECPLSDLADHPSLRFVLQAIRQHVAQLPSGFELKIESEFSADIGFGSSAAVTVATHGAVLNWILGEAPAPKTVFEQALQTVLAVQGRGSGADLAASVFGGMVGYTTAPSFEPVTVAVPLTAVYCGYKTPTPEVILKVEQLRAEDPRKYERIYREMDVCAVSAVEGLRRHDLPGLGTLLNRNQQLMDELGVNTPELREIVDALQTAPDVFGAKISGSGLGDCAIGIGYAELKAFAYPVYHLEIVPRGIEYYE